jgi:hypothetical protein
METSDEVSRQDWIDCVDTRTDRGVFVGLCGISAAERQTGGCDDGNVTLNVDFEINFNFRCGTCCASDNGPSFECG